MLFLLSLCLKAICYDCRTKLFNLSMISEQISNVILFQVPLFIIKTFIHYFLDTRKNIAGETFGQKRPPLSEIIKGILKEYPSGQIFKVAMHVCIEVVSY